MSEQTKPESSKAEEPAAATPVQNTPRSRRWLRPLLLLAGPAIVIIVGLGWYYSGGRYVSTENAYVHASMVAISARVNGIIIDVDVRANQTVEKGSVLFQIDPEPYRIAVDRARANLAVQRQELQALKDTYVQQASSLDLARINLAYTERTYDRRARLSKTDVVSPAQLDEARTALDTARQQVVIDTKAMKRTLAELGGQIDTPVEELPAYRQAKAALEQAQLDLSHTTVLAPFDGVVSNKPEPGAYVTPGSAIMSLVAQGDQWVEANFKEIDLTHVKPGQSVEITVDTFPDRIWHGTVESLSPATGAAMSVLPAQNATGNWVKVVQRIPVRIRVTHQDDLPPLRVGMSTVVEIDTRHSRRLPGFAKNLLSRFAGEMDVAPPAEAAPAHPERNAM